MTYVVSKREALPLVFLMVNVRARTHQLLGTRTRVCCVYAAASRRRTGRAMNRNANLLGADGRRTRSLMRINEILSTH